MARTERERLASFAHEVLLTAPLFYVRAKQDLRDLDETAFFELELLGDLIMGTMSYVYKEKPVPDASSRLVELEAGRELLESLLASDPPAKLGIWLTLLEWSRRWTMDYLRFPPSQTGP